MKSLILALCLLFSAATKAINHYPAHTFAGPLTDFALSQLRISPGVELVFVPSVRKADLLRNGKPYYSSESMGNQTVFFTLKGIAELVAAGAHIVLSYHLPQLVDRIALKGNGQRTEAQNIASFLGRTADISYQERLQLALKVGRPSLHPKNLARHLLTEFLVQQIPTVMDAL